MRPGAARLLMNGPVGLRDGFKLEQAVGSLGRDKFGELTARAIAIDNAVNNRMHDMNTLR